MFKLITEMEKYKSIIENIKECYFEVDLRGNFTFFNESVLKLLGYSRDELLGLNYKHLADEETRSNVFKGFNTVYETCKPLTDFQYQFRNKKGEKIIGETSVYLKYDAKRNKIGFCGLFRDITKRKEEEERFKEELENKVRLRTKELRESEEKYSNLFHHSNDAIFLHDLEGNIIDANQKVLEQFGYTRSEIIRFKIQELHPIEELESSKRVFEEISKKGVIRFEISFKKKNGEIFLAEVSSSLFNIGGKKVIQGIVRDISERKLAEQKLKDSEEKHRNMINNLDLGFYQLSWDGILLNHNPAFSKILGFDPSENLINKNVHDFWQKPEERITYLDELKKLGNVKNYLVHAKKKYGEKIVLHLNSHIIEKRKGNPNIIQGLITDITEKFKLEQKLKESEERYRNLFESMPFSIALLDQKGRVVYCNPASEKLLGYNKEDLIGEEFRNLSIIHPQYLPLIMKRFKKVIKGENLSPIEIQIYKKNGNLTWINYQTSLVNLGNESLLQVIINDISEKKKAELLIIEEVKKLKELDQIRKDLISRVSHELKTPLVSVCGGSELLLQLYKPKLDADVLELLELIEKGGKRLKYLVDNLLDITRIEYNKLKLNKELNDLSKIIKDCAKELLYLARVRELDLDLKLVDNLYLEIDKIRLEQVIINLLSNAIKNTPPKGKIEILLQKKEDWAEISVIDTGIGLTKGEMDILFTRFGKIERYGEGLEYIDIQGSGLGLYISKEIVDLHRGQIRAESAGRNKGSIFIVKLPIN